MVTENECLKITTLQITADKKKYNKKIRNKEKGKHFFMLQIRNYVKRWAR